MSLRRARLVCTSRHSASTRVCHHGTYSNEQGYQPKFGSLCRIMLDLPVSPWMDEQSDVKFVEAIDIFERTRQGYFWG
jgi:hypothetical protein